MKTALIVLFAIFTSRLFASATLLCQGEKVSLLLHGSRSGEEWDPATLTVNGTEWQFDNRTNALGEVTNPLRYKIKGHRPLVVTKPNGELLFRLKIEESQSKLTLGKTFGGRKLNVKCELN